MRAQRLKQLQWGKPFKIVPTKLEFLALEVPQTQNNTGKLHGQNKKDNQNVPKKQDISVPKIQNVTRINRIANQAGIPLNYIRLPLQLNLPRQDKYQLSEVDYTFLLANQNIYNFGNRKALTRDLLEKSFVQLELMAGKQSSVLPKNNKTRLKAMIQREYDYLMKMDHFQLFLDLIYNHWRSRRQELKAPILRMLWKPSADDNNHYLAFRPRDKEKMKLRRINKSNDEENRMNMQNLLRQLQQAREIANRVKQRQKLKFLQFNLELQKFHAETKSFNKQEPLFFHQITKKDISKHRENIQKFKNQYQSNKNTNYFEDNNIFQGPVENPKESVINFLCTLIHKSSEYDIDYDALMGIKQVSNNSIKINLQKKIDEDLNLKPPVTNPKIIKQQSENICNFNMRILGTNNELFIERNFEKNNRNREQRKQKQQPNFFECRHKKICQNYYFQDDDEQGKDIKRTISMNFKRFLALKKIEA